MSCRRKRMWQKHNFKNALFLYKTVSNYDLPVTIQLYKNLQEVLKFLDILVQESTLGISDRKIRNKFRKEITDLRRNMYREEFL